MSRNISPELAAKLAPSIRAYPSLHKRGGDVLEHIFCVNGNGYEWVGGEPVQISMEGLERDENIYESFAAFVTYWERNAPERKGRDRARHLKYVADRYASDCSVIATAAERALDKRMTNRYVYPLCQYAMINNLPADLKPVWQEAVEIVREMLEWYPDSNERDLWGKEEFIIREDLDIG